MKKFLVEFSSIYSDPAEIWEQNQAVEKAESMGIEPKFSREKDYVGTTVIDMEMVVGFEEGIVYLNDQPCDCIYAEYDDLGKFSRNLLVKKDAFKKILEHVSESSILKPNEILAEDESKQEDNQS